MHRHTIPHECRGSFEGDLGAIRAMTRHTGVNTTLDQPVKRRGNGLYLAFWGLLGCLAAVYLVMVAMGKPPHLDDFAFWQSGAKSPNGSMLRQDAGNVVQFQSMQQEIAGLKTSVGQVAADLKQLSTTQRQTLQRVARLETGDLRGVPGQPTPSNQQPGSQSPDTQSPSITVSGNGQQTSSQSSAIEGTTLDGVTHTTPQSQQQSTTSGTAGEDPLLTALIGNDPQQSASQLPLTPQPSTTAAVPAPAPAVVPIPGRPAYGVELASGNSVDSLRLSWALLNERHRDLLGRLAPRYVQTGSGASSLYRLIAGPFSSPARAGELCLQLQAYYVPCRTSAFSGSVL